MKKCVILFFSLCIFLNLFAKECGKCNITEETQKVFNEEDLKLKRALFLYDLYPDIDFDKCFEYAEDDKFKKIVKRLKEKGYKIDSLLNVSYIN